MVVVALRECVESALQDVTPALLCQLFFALATAAVLVVAATPPSARRLLTQYGARGSTQPPDASRDNGKSRLSPGQDVFTAVVSWATSVGKVPHSWFIYFYVLSVLSSIFWGIQYITDGSVLNFIARHQAEGAGASMTTNSVKLAWLLMLMQGMRRLTEHLTILKPSKSKMWVIHWFLGCAYYLCMNIAVWVEGSSAILHSDRRRLSFDLPSANQLIAVPLFLSAWTMQYQCHRYLSSLKKYSLPSAGMFRYLICPHYTCECLIYLSLALLAAPNGHWYNKTIVSGLTFVAANLGITASGTKKWYADKFGSSSIKDRWNMIPFVY